MVANGCGLSVSACDITRHGQFSFGYAFNTMKTGGFVGSGERMLAAVETGVPRISCRVMMGLCLVATSRSGPGAFARRLTTVTNTRLWRMIAWGLQAGHGVRRRVIHAGEVVAMVAASIQMSVEGLCRQAGMGRCSRRTKAEPPGSKPRRTAPQRDPAAPGCR